ncbi:MAG: LamG domain-containing protein [Candidatus Eisenbacteria bacterium]|nr:LamG domain-containing protein [Candidatus Eisenbacteria bacterium]
MSATPASGLPPTRSPRPGAGARLPLGACALGVVFALTGCAHGGHTASAPAPRPETSALPADSATVAIWHMDETADTRVADAGSFRLDGTAGIEARTGFGRYGRARVFTHALDSFVLVPFDPALEPHSGFTVEAWVLPTSYGSYEDTPIAGRWTVDGNRESWLFSIVGRRQIPPVVPRASPGDHAALTPRGSTGALMFAFMPADAGSPRSYFSTQPVSLNRWSHVAATYDGTVVRLWINGVLDAQYASLGRIRSSGASLQIGNALDPRWLSRFGGDLRADQARDATPYYAFEGLIDELRISSVARAGFEYARGR